MSKIYQRRLERVRDERDTTLETFAYVRDNWFLKSLFNEARFTGRTLDSVTQVTAGLDATFMIRLFAAFEGMMREHMREHHPNPPVPEDVGAAYLIDRVASAQVTRISIALCNDVHEVRQYRNSLMHPDGKEAAEVTFNDALAKMARFVGWLPEPK